MLFVIKELLTYLFMPLLRLQRFQCTFFGIFGKYLQSSMQICRPFSLSKNWCSSLTIDIFICFFRPLLIFCEPCSLCSSCTSGAYNYL